MELKCSGLLHPGGSIFQVLIVPYGIEINKERLLIIKQIVLIVPYGIEMTFSGTEQDFLPGFNRTLWN